MQSRLSMDSLFLLVCGGRKKDPFVLLQFWKQSDQAQFGGEEAVNVPLSKSSACSATGRKMHTSEHMWPEQKIVDCNIEVTKLTCSTTGTQEIAGVSMQE
eukprot:scaffold155573_cov15-Tisochrysis_lutea.AAC.2